MKTLHGKLVAITGAGSGIGRALALRCAGLGANLAISDVNEPGLADTARDARARGAAVDVTRVDVADRAAIYGWAEHIRSSLGGADVIVNNAGVSLSQSIETMRDEDFEWLFNINFWGVVHGCKAFLPQLREKPEAHVVNVSSVFGIIAVPSQAAYNAAKFAVRGYTEALRQELRKTSVGVTCVHPGGIKTNIVRNGKHYEDATGKASDTTTLSKRFDREARTTPDEAARVIVNAILRNQRRLLIGADAYLIDAIARLFPSSYDWVVARASKIAMRVSK